MLCGGLALMALTSCNTVASQSEESSGGKTVISREEAIEAALDNLRATRGEEALEVSAVVDEVLLEEDDRSLQEVWVVRMALGDGVTEERYVDTASGEVLGGSSTGH
jgi:uncharacterized membrane protein YkoI